MSQAVGLNRELSLPTYEEVCSSGVEIGFRSDLTRAASASTTSDGYVDHRTRIPNTTNQERVEESNGETRTKKSKKCLIFTITGLVVFCYLFTVVGLLRSKNCLLPADQESSIGAENKILAIHRSYDKKINYLNAQQKAMNQTWEKKVNALVRACEIAENEKQHLQNKLEDLRKEMGKLLGQREQLYVQLMRAGLTPVYNTSTTDRTDKRLGKITS